MDDQQPEPAISSDDSQAEGHELDQQWIVDDDGVVSNATDDDQPDTNDTPDPDDAP